MSKGLIWFREDLRLTDNTALYFASKSCPAGIAGIYIIDPNSWQHHDLAPCRVNFILSGLKTLQADLQDLGIPLVCLTVNNVGEIPGQLEVIMKKIKAQALFFNYQYEIDEVRRDHAVQRHLSKLGIACHAFHDQTILPPGSVRTQQDTFFKIFTPYKRAWLQVLSNKLPLKLLPKPYLQQPLPLKILPLPDKIKNFTLSIPNLWPAGEKFAVHYLKDFIQNKLFSYDKQRDFPYLEGTSCLSPYLATGMISSRQCFLAALEQNQWQLDGGNQGALTWMTELIWREYYKHLLAAVPRLSMHKPFILATDKLPWNKNEIFFQAWSKGVTGFPIIDAAMRQLTTTGWMHNRLRMITAMFLARNLFLDWRLGEKFFMRHLIDGDLAANNGGWQWCAATGADCAPFFRVFNPIRQSERFDPHGNFIRKFCPELIVFDNKAIHDPWQRAPKLAQTIGYPSPLVDLKQSTMKFIKAYRKNNQ